MEENNVEQIEIAETPETEVAETPEAEVAEKVMDEQEFVEKPKRSLKKLLIALGAVVVVLAIAIPLTYTLIFNNYKTPLKLAAAVENVTTFEDTLKASTKQSNGLIDKEANRILDILLNSEEFDLDYIEELMETQIDSLKDEYGDDYKYYYVIEDKLQLDKDDLKDLKDEIKDFAKEDIKEDILEEFEDFDSDDWEDAAEDLGVSKADAKALIKELESIYDKLKSVKITKGYELSVVLMVRGSELDEPEEISEDTITVCKVNGRWICPDCFTDLLDLLYI